MWHAAKASGEWRVEWRLTPGAEWTIQPAIDRLTLVDRDVLTAVLPVGRSGDAFEYRIARGGVIAFAGHGRAPVGPGQPVRFAVIADTGDGSDSQRALARQLVGQHRTAPLAFGLIAGDVAYDCGRREEYSRNFFPIYNPSTGESLMRSVPLATAVGNHDVADLRWPLPPFRCASDYSHFAFWRHPQSLTQPIPNGPKHNPKRPIGGGPMPAVDVNMLLASANYSFDWGDAHVTVLDSNRYVDWSHPSMQRWLDQDLAAAQASNIRWRFVMFHHPPFSQSKHQGGDQWMRYVIPMLERHRVTAVFSGHVHNFQWFGPLHFQPDPADAQRYERGERTRLRGVLEAQADYDGVTSTAARWPVYVISGAGGGSRATDGNRCPFDVMATAGCGSPLPADGRFASATIVEVDAAHVTMRQVTADGSVLLTRRLTAPISDTPDLKVRGSIPKVRGSSLKVRGSMRDKIAR